MGVLSEYGTSVKKIQRRNVMKFKRLLAAILSAMMITSCMSFVADAQEAEIEADIGAIEDIVVEEVEEEAQEEVPAEENDEAVLAEETTEEGTETTETVTISFDKTNGGYPLTGADNRVSTVEVAVGDVIPFPADPTYVCRTFKGWSTSDGGEVIADTSNITATTAQTYYAIWEYTHTGKALAEINAKREYKDNSNIMAAEGCNTDGKFYDAIEDKIFENYNVKTSGKSGSCNMYSGFNYSIAGTELYMAALVRTNMTGYAGTAGIYQSVDKTGAGKNWTAMKQIDTITEADTWTKVILKSTGLTDFGWGKQIDYDVTGSHPATNVGTDYYDVVGMALFNTQAEAEAYDFDAVESSDYQVYFNVNYDNAESVTTFPTDVPEKRTDTEGNVYCFDGWTTDESLAGVTVTPEEAASLTEEGVILSEDDLRRTAIPTDDVTYYAVWGDTVEEANTVYISANGSDENGGLHSLDAVATVEKAYQIIKANETVDTICIVGTVETPSDSLGMSGYDIKFKGYDNSALLHFTNGVRVYMRGNVAFENITIQSNYKSELHFATIKATKVTIGEGVFFKGINTSGVLAASTLVGDDYGSAQSVNCEIVINGSNYAGTVIPGAGYAGQTKTGNIKTVVNAGTITELRLTKGSTGNGSVDNMFKGTVEYEINGGTVKKLQFGQGGNFNGLGYAVINGGTVDMVYTKSVNHSWAGWVTNPAPLTDLKGVMVFEINGGTVKRIATQSDGGNQLEKYIAYQATQGNTVTEYPDTWGNIKRVVIFNNGVDAITVEDPAAMVLDVAGGSLKAVATVPADSENAYLYELDGFTYTLTAESKNAVIINDAEPIALSTFEDNFIPATYFEAGKVNTVRFVNAAEPDHIAAYREAGYRIVYVASKVRGEADGLYHGDEVAWNGGALSGYIADGGKTVFVLTDKITVVDVTVKSGATAVLTAYDENGIFYFEGSTRFYPQCTSAASVPANIIMDNIHILHKNGSEGGERILNFCGNNITFTETVTNDSSSYPGKGPLNLHVCDDGTQSFTNSAGKMVMTLNGGSRLSIRAGGWGGVVANANIEFNLGGNAQVSALACGGHCASTSLTNAQRTVNGDITVNVYDDAVVNSIQASNRGIVNGDITINVNGGTVKEITPSTGNADTAVNGSIIVKVNGGTIGNITAKGATVSGEFKADIDLDNATITGNINAALEHAVAKRGKGTYVVNTADDGTKTLAITPDATTKYIRITNGDTKKEYNVQGDEVSLLADVDFSAIPLATGLTTIEFFAEGEAEEIPAEVTLNFYANIPDENGDTTASNAAAWVTKTSAWGATEDVLPVWSDVGRENAAANDTFARPDRDGYRFLGWADTADAEAPNVDPATFTIDADAYRTKNYYAVWEPADMIADDEVTITLVSDKANSPIPEDATEYRITYADNKYSGELATVYNADDSVYTTINSGLAVPGLAKNTEGSTSTTTTSSYFGASGNTNTVLFPDGTVSAWFKWNDGKYIGVKTPYTGVVNVAYVINATPSATTKRGFYLEAGDVAGTLNLATIKEGTADFVVSFRTTLEEGDIIKYAGPADFNNNTIKAGQLLGIYVWPYKDVYLSDSGDDANDGLTADAPVKTLARVQEILGENSGMDTVKIVGTYTYRTRIDLKADGSNATIVNTTTGFYIGIPGRTITVTGVDENAMFSLNDPNADDEVLTLRGDVTFENIKYEGSTNDGRVIAYGGYSLTFGEGITASKNTSAATENNHAGTINILSGSFTRVYPGSFGSSAQYQPVTLNVDGDGTSVGAVALGHGWHNTNGYFGAMYVNVTNGAKIGTAKIQSNGAGTVAKYSGLRYFTVDASVIENVYTTGKAKQSWSGGAAEVTNAADRTGITVFEFNNGSTLVNPANAGDGVDSSTRIFVFNSGSTGTVNDTGAIVIRPQNGTIHPDVTANVPGGSTRATATLNGYRYTTDATNEYICINGTNYLLSDFANAGEEASLSEEVTVLIPAELFTAESDNVAIFSEAPLYTVTWKNGEETIKTELVAEGSTLTAPAVNKASTKAAYYTFKAWNDGTADIADITAYTVPAGGATLTAVFEEHAMPASASIQYSAFSQVNNVAGVFTHAVETIDGVEAVKITPAADSETAINLEGSGKYPENYSTGTKSNVLDPAIYDYAVYRYYYVPGTNTEDRTFYIWYQKHPWEDTTLVAPDGGSFTMEAGKWTYIVDKLDRADGTEPDLSIQYHLRPMNNVAAKDLAANGEYIYVDSMQLFSAEPTVATVTFKGDDSEVLYAIDALNSEAVTYNGAAVEKADHTFKGWAIEGTTDVVEALTFAQDTTLVPVFEENPQEVFPTSPTYKTYGKYDASAGIYEVELKLSGTTGNVGSFGFTFPTEYMTLKSVTANAEAGVVLLPEEASEVAQSSPIFVKENGNYANTWTAELATGYGYVDATTEEVLIATFTFDMTADQRAAFKTAVVDTNNKFAEYAVANADEKYYKDNKYLVAPYSADLSTNKVGIDYVSHTDEEGEVEVTTATITLTVDLHDDRGTAGTSLATLAVNGGEAVVIEQAGVGGDITYTISGLEIGKPCTISVKKNGYVEGLCVVTPTETTNTLTMKLVAGDIKGAADAVCGDGVINLDDFVRVIRAFDPYASDDFKKSMDIDEDGYVNVADLAFIKANYGQKIGNATITFNGETVTPGTEA